MDQYSAPADTAPPRRLRIDLPGTIADALTRLAIREDRDARAQAVRLIADGLRRTGDLPAEPSR